MRRLIIFAASCNEDAEPKGNVPALVWTFQITDDNNVVMTHVEECEGY